MITRRDTHDESRIAILLDDLAVHTRTEAAAVEFECESECPGPLVGTATRAGVLRLGVDIARASQNASSVWINRDGSVNTNAHPVNTVIGIDILPPVPPTHSPHAPNSSRWDWVLEWLGVFWLVVLTLALIGILTVMDWLQT